MIKKILDNNFKKILYLLIENQTSTEAISESTTQVFTTTTPKTCPYNGACGWGVYGENKKKIKYFIRNTCRCSPEYGCLLDDDDLSLSAFIYSCKERKATATT